MEQEKESRCNVTFLDERCNIVGGFIGSYKDLNNKVERLLSSGPLKMRDNHTGLVWDATIGEGRVNYWLTPVDTIE